MQSKLLSLAMSGVAFWAMPAPAQTNASGTAASDDTTFGLGQIVVTAPRVDGVAIGGDTLSSNAIFAFDRQRLDDAVNLIPGVNASNTGGSRNERLILVRGFNRFQVPLLIDGIRVFLPADNRLDYGRFLTSDIAEVQVAKGYASVLDGPDGMGGAINLVTRKPAKPFEAQVQGTLNLGRAVEYGGYNVAGLIGTRQDKWYAQASYARNYTDHWDLAGGFVPTASEDGGHRGLSQSRDWRANVKAGFTPNDTDEYSINYTRQEGEKLAPLSTTDPVSIQRNWSWPYWNLSSVYFLSTTALGEQAALKTKIYYNQFDNLLSAWDDATLTTQTKPRAFNSFYHDEAWGGSAQLDVRPVTGDTLSLAFFYRRDRHVEYQQGYPGGAFEPPQTSIEDGYSIAAQNVAELAPALTLSAGVSYDWKDLRRAEDYANGAYVYYPLVNHAALNGQARLSWKPDERSELYASVSDRTRFPTLFERFSSRFGGAVSNADLKPERAVNYEIGASHRFGIWRAEGALFYSHVTDAIVSEPFIYTSCTPGGVCTPNAVTKSFNLGHGNFYGGELSLTAQILPSLAIGGNYTYTHRDLRDPGVPIFRPTDVPTHKAFVYADWSPLTPLHIRPSADIASDRWTVNTAGTAYFRTGHYDDVGLAVDYDISDRLTVGLGARNLLDQNYQLAAGFPEPGRSFFARISARYG
ncbi:MAG: TonB-dependent receptor [Sphingomonas sp. 67-36]|uniref:TonB-dependent receptor plug domain-containing protein n=2 Tax=unclassified Sphingomonas TaxID=196159 RepID=UPI00092A972B|nr:TonB-dependent receptor [Sphingomonas sp.]MBN8847984.1 TonB-dependent receptor [Sphingomonas sp.]OJV34221.1 MAG: TonB-dependent receptor [Sphingomonas sp. 67-36]